MMKLNIGAFALACGIWWGVGMFLLTWWVIAFVELGAGPTFIERIYLGYEFTALGSVIGLVWGFVDGLIGGAVFAWLYNLLVNKLVRPTDQATGPTQQPA